jgi:5-methyltetrahydropteroyltriglutamate--homocysteine methyltransferase
VIRPNLKALEKAGARVVQIDEPAATTHPEEVDIFVEGFNAATEGLKPKVTAHICYSDYRLLYPAVLEMKRCSQFAWEFANRDANFGDGYKPLELFREYDDGREVGLGVVDVHVSRVESPEEVRDRILKAAKVLGDEDRIYVNPDCGLRTRTWKVAFEKLRNMVRGARLARVAFEGE